MVAVERHDDLDDPVAVQVVHREAAVEERVAGVRGVVGAEVVNPLDVPGGVDGEQEDVRLEQDVGAAVAVDVGDDGSGRDGEGLRNDRQAPEE